MHAFHEGAFRTRPPRVVSAGFSKNVRPGWILITIVVRRCAERQIASGRAERQLITVVARMRTNAVRSRELHHVCYNLVSLLKDQKHQDTTTIENFVHAVKEEATLVVLYPDPSWFRRQHVYWVRKQNVY